MGYAESTIYNKLMPDPQITYLVKKNLLRTVHASVGTDIFRNIYVRRADGTEFDAIDDGENSCAYFVSAILAMHRLLDQPHAIVDTTINKILEAGWRETDKPTPGSIIFWPEKDGHSHIGFYISEDKAISNHADKKQPTEHGLEHPIDGRVPTKFYTHDKLLSD